VKVLPPSLEKPSPVPCALGDGQPENSEVASFHASTTYLPEAAIEVSACP
jgi:hypothetical protein